ncbi:MAG TPA: ATP-binding cassette domain-containing protein [Pyrinomonadaceae bacterium]|jgi:ABC-type transporter Mla maintaining outer membrane lipid asymmetry ATPase subunit MlaF|nr:ATP-binding cassette domain-containing protein [Pyrinomonadaceae bacterium]
MGTETKNPVAVEFRNVSLSFDEKKVLSDIDLKLGRGEMIFITGVSGSGKSVLLRLAIALESPSSGQILVEGRDLALLDEAELLDVRGNRMGIVFQEDSLFTGLTVYDNVAYRLVEHGVGEEEIEKAVRDVLQFVGLERDAEKLPAELSGGMRRRLEIARALVGWPSIMLFDEPASGLDPLTAIQVLDLIIRARDIYGISSLYVTKKLDEIPYLATHRARLSEDGVVIEDADSQSAPTTSVVVLDRGQIVFRGSVAEFEASSLPAVTMLTKADNGMVMSDFAPSDPWDKTRRPAEKIL